MLKTSLQLIIVTATHIRGWLKLFTILKDLTTLNYS